MSTLCTDPVLIFNFFFFLNDDILFICAKVLISTSFLFLILFPFFYVCMQACYKYNKVTRSCPEDCPTCQVLAQLVAEVAAEVHLCPSPQPCALLQGEPGSLGPCCLLDSGRDGLRRLPHIPLHSSQEGIGVNGKWHWHWSWALSCVPIHACCELPFPVAFLSIG